MFKVQLSMDTRVLISSKTDFLIIPVKTFKRARERKRRGSKIRKPIVVVIDGYLSIFTRKEWMNGKRTALDYRHFYKWLPNFIRQEIEYRVKMSKRLSKQRTLRLLIEANTAKERDLENSHLRNRVIPNATASRTAR